MTISYGHGLSASPLHLAAGYATLANGGTQGDAHAAAQPGAAPGPRGSSRRHGRGQCVMLRRW
jgi:cell division protein FtsI (penicillin-binding protein 3)